MLLLEKRRRAGGRFALTIATPRGGDAGRAGVPLTPTHLCLIVNRETPGEMLLVEY